MVAEFGMNAESIVVMRQHQIMRTLCKYQMITVGEVSRKTGLSKTYCYNLLQGMEYRGLVSSQKRMRGTTETRLYMTAYDAIVQGKTVKELPDEERAAMATGASEGVSANEWYGYATSGSLVMVQEVMF